jgi:imidazole glycerol-phosphate synthase subunit HisF
MLRTRVIPCLLLSNQGLVKTKKFKAPAYIGDPLNAVKIFNEKEVHELMFLDIGASVNGTSPPLQMIADISDECYMPLAYGGGIKSMREFSDVFTAGAEKVVINSGAFKNIGVISEAAKVFGSQSIVGAIDVKKSILGKYEVRYCSGKKRVKWKPWDYAKELEDYGVGEILLTSIDRDGMQCGYDLELVERVCQSVSVPVVANGGAGGLKDFEDVVRQGHASAVAAGSMFVYHGTLNGILINYPDEKELFKYLN